ncbi:unnamed protein product, partial [Sphagnum troendelagicum]
PLIPLPKHNPLSHPWIPNSGSPSDPSIDVLHLFCQNQQSGPLLYQGFDAPIVVVDPCKGGLGALQGVGLATSHCLTQNFSSDPTFVEQATNFSSFNGDVDHSQALGQPLSMLTNSPKLHSRLGRGQQAHESNGKLSQTSSSSIGVKIGGEVVSSFQTCVDGMKVNIAEHDSQVTQVCANSNDEKEPYISKQDYIHVRARRGQATDSHSLAERVRREKISERMKYLQDLVPGCSKVTGKALMLDEIINYVQSLQRQVEHLSMKLASMPPQMDVVNFDPVITKEMLSQSRGITSVVDHASFFNHHAKLQQPLSQLGGAIGVGAVNLRQSLNCNLETGNNCDTTQLCRSLSSMDGVAFQDSEIQGSTVWDGDLQSIVQMGILQCGPTSMMSQGLKCPLPVGHMKVEL